MTNANTENTHFIRGISTELLTSGFTRLNLYNKGDCLCACVFSIGGHTVGPTELKFGMEDHIYPREVIGYILFPNTYPPGGGRPKSGSGDPCSPNGAFL